MTRPALGGWLAADSVERQKFPFRTFAAAHDLRRTFAKLAHKGGAGLDQIQLSLGHASIKTTERYVGIAQDLQDAPCDHIDCRRVCRSHGAP